MVRCGNKIWVWHKKKVDYTENNQISNIKYGGESVMLWCCFSSKGPGTLVRIHENIDFMKYEETLN